MYIKYFTLMYYAMIFNIKFVQNLQRDLFYFDLRTPQQRPLESASLQVLTSNTNKPSLLTNDVIQQSVTTLREKKAAETLKHLDDNISQPFESNKVMFTKNYLYIYSQQLQQLRKDYLLIKKKK